MCILLRSPPPDEACCEALENQLLRGHYYNKERDSLERMEDVRIREGLWLYVFKTSCYSSLKCKGTEMKANLNQRKLT
jgi:hypothetical protein